MGPIIDFTFFIVQSLLWLILWVVLIYVVVTWLVAFNVLNMRNRVAFNVVRYLEAVARPILRPLQRIIPPMGSMDLSPLILLLVIQGTQIYLLPPLHVWLLTQFG